jgi:hypothetical protein
MTLCLNFTFAPSSYSSTQTTFPLVWPQNWIFPVHLSRRWTPIDDEMTCHRKRKTIDPTMISAATMMVIGERFMDSSLRRVTETWRCSLQTWPLPVRFRNRSRALRHWRLPATPTGEAGRASLRLQACGCGTSPPSGEYAPTAGRFKPDSAAALGFDRLPRGERIIRHGELPSCRGLARRSGR